MLALLTVLTLLAVLAVLTLLVVAGEAESGHQPEEAQALENWFLVAVPRRRGWLRV